MAKKSEDSKIVDLLDKIDKSLQTDDFNRIEVRDLLKSALKSHSEWNSDLKNKIDKLKRNIGAPIFAIDLELVIAKAKAAILIQDELKRLEDLFKDKY